MLPDSTTVCGLKSKKAENQLENESEWAGIRGSGWEFVCLVWNMFGERIVVFCMLAVFGTWPVDHQPKQTFIPATCRD